MGEAKDILLITFLPRKYSESRPWNRLSRGSAASFRQHRSQLSDSNKINQYKKWRFSLKISSVNVTKSSVNVNRSSGNWKFGHIY